MAKNELRIESNNDVSEMVEIFWNVLDYRNVDQSFRNTDKALTTRYNKLQTALIGLFNDGRLSKTQIRVVLDYSQRTLFAHLNLFLTCLAVKQHRKQKKIELTASVPLRAPAGGLVSANCKEIVEEQTLPEEHVLDLDGTGGGQGAGDGQQEDGQLDDAAEEEEEDLIVDPSDPLYGLELRLKHTNLDDMTRSVIKAKLLEAQAKINDKLEARQANLD